MDVSDCPTAYHPPPWLQHTATQPGQDATTFSWLIDSTVDTTVSATDCAYDRAITTGGFRTTTSASVVRFDTELALSPALTADVSDHYPVYAWLGLVLAIVTYTSAPCLDAARP